MCQETRRICETVMVQKSCFSADKPKHGANKLLVRQFGWGNNGSAFGWSVRQSKVLTSYFITKVIYTICIHTGRSCTQMLHLWNIYRHCLKTYLVYLHFLAKTSSIPTSWCKKNHPRFRKAPRLHPWKVGILPYWRRFGGPYQNVESTWNLLNLPAKCVMRNTGVNLSVKALLLLLLFLKSRIIPGRSSGIRTCPVGFFFATHVQKKNSW